MQLEHKSFYVKNKVNVQRVAVDIRDTMKEECVAVAFISKLDILHQLGLQAYQTPVILSALNRAFKDIHIDLGITAYDNEFFLVLTDPVILEVWDDEDNSDAIDDVDDERNENDLSEYICEVCGKYKASKPRCNKCVVAIVGFFPGR